MTELIPGQLYMAKIPFRGTDCDNNTNKKIWARPLLILSSSIKEADLIQFKFLVGNKIYEAKLFNNPSFYFRELT